jgi:hypothetical protein
MVSDTLYESLFVFVNSEVDYQFTNDKLRNEALKVLVQYGDHILKSCQTSVKHQALYTYFIRLIRPVWELNLVSMQDD